MSKFQQPYNQAKIKAQREMVPAIKDQIDELRAMINNAEDPDMKKGLQQRLKALQIKMKSYRAGDPVKEDEEFDEEAQGAVTTGSVGAATMSTGDGGTEPAIYGSSHIHAKHMGTLSRKGGYKPPKQDDKRKKKVKKKNKKNESFAEYYFDESENMQDDLRREIKKAHKEKNAEKELYYIQSLDKSAVVSFDRFKGSWAYEGWKKKFQDEIDRIEKEYQRFNW